jgi:hypothetical protein
MQDSIYRPTWDANTRYHLRMRFLPAAVYLLAAIMLLAIVERLGM